MNSLSIISLVATIVLFGAAIFLGVQNRTEAVRNRLQIEQIQKQIDAGTAPVAKATTDIEARLLQQAAREQQASVELQRKEQEIAALKSQLEAESVERQQLDAQFNRIQEDKNRPLSAEQQKIAQAAAIARVTQFVPDLGFVALDAGLDRQLSAGDEFHIRRGNYLIGKVIVSDTIEANSCIADVDPSSIPQGYTIQPGDEVVQYLP